jgi:hypothetical protein
MEQEILKTLTEWKDRQTSRNATSESVWIQIQRNQIAQEPYLARDCAIEIVNSEIQKLDVSERPNGDWDCTAKAVIRQIQIRQTSGKHVNDGTNVSRQLVPV